MEYDIREDDHPLHEWLTKLDRELLVFDEGAMRRKPRWSPAARSRFVESILLNVPVPPLYVFQQQDGTYVLLDGGQRMQALRTFRQGRWKLRGLTVLGEFNGCTFAQLPPRQQAHLESCKVRCFVVKRPCTDEALDDLYARLQGTQY